MKKMNAGYQKKYIPLMLVCLVSFCCGEASDERMTVDLKKKMQADVLIGFSGVVWRGEKLSVDDISWRLEIVSHGRTFRLFRIRGESVAPGGILRMLLQGTEHPSAPTIALEIEPLSDAAAGRLANTDWRGFRYRYHLEENTAAGCMIEESIRWRMTSAGNNPEYWIRNLFWIAEYVPGESPPFGTLGDKWYSRFGRMSPFDFHEGNGCAFLVYPEEPAAIWNRTSAASNEVPTVSDRYYLTPGNKNTVWKRVVFTRNWPMEKTGKINGFNHLWLALRSRYVEQAGLSPANALLPFVGDGAQFSKIEPLLPEIGRLGFKIISVGPFWKSSATEGGGRRSMSVYDYTVADQWGGIEALRRFCAAAALYDIRVCTWFPTFHLSDQSPLLAEHPAWKAKADGMDDYGGKLVPLNTADGELRKRIREHLAAIRAAGVSALWMDSCHSFGVESYLPHEEWREPLFPHFLDALREIRSLGFTLYAEAYTPLAVSSFGMTKSRAQLYSGNEFRLPAMSPFPEGVSHMSGVNYFAFLAFGSPLLLSSYAWPVQNPLWKYSEEDRKNLADWNAQYVKAVPDMKTLHGLIAGGKGVLWRGENTHIVFALQDFHVAAKGMIRITDLKNGSDIPIQGDVAFTAHTVYRLKGNIPAELMR